MAEKAKVIGRKTPVRTAQRKKATKVEPAFTMVSDPVFDKLQPCAYHSGSDGRFIVQDGNRFTVTGKYVRPVG